MKRVCLYTIYTQSIQVWHVCPVRMGRLILKLSSIPSLKTREHKIADKPEKMKYKCVQIKWWDEALKCNVNMKNSFGFCGFFFFIFRVCFYYMSTFHYLLVQATSTQFVIVLFGWRAKIKRYCYTKLCELLHTNVYILFATGAGADMMVVLLQPLACFTRIFIPTENRIKSNEMEEK